MIDGSPRSACQGDRHLQASRQRLLRNEISMSIKGETLLGSERIQLGPDRASELLNEIRVGGGESGKVRHSIVNRNAYASNVVLLKKRPRPGAVRFGDAVTLRIGDSRRQSEQAFVYLPEFG